VAGLINGQLSLKRHFQELLGNQEQEISIVNLDTTVLIPQLLQYRALVADFVAKAALNLLDVHLEPCALPLPRSQLVILVVFPQMRCFWAY
jgi:hypothetical protein